MKAAQPLLLMTLSFLTACSPVKNSLSNLYSLDSYSQVSARPTSLSILVSKPEAMAGYQTNQMVYRSKPFELSSFAQNAWVAPPADMLYPLIVESLQQTHFFRVVASGPYAAETDYRLDTQLFVLDQRFISHPSQVYLSVKAVLSASQNNKVIASTIFHYHMNTPADNPYGGVVAANKASQQFTADLSRFIIRHIERAGK